ncbi:MAG: DNA internalization-related competence protein ComEC/Rec2 [Desulfobacterales bacterium]|nr:DNA internalization-related competence protein ComEC/Rec2 [Desulfobacterales bacterium]
MVLAGCFLGWGRLRPPILWCVALAFLFSLGWYRSHGIDHDPWPENSIFYHADGGKYHIQGRVVSFARHYPNKTRIVVECSQIRPIGKNISNEKPVAGKIHLSLPAGQLIRSRFGTPISFKGRLRGIRNFQNPGAFDYVGFLRRKGVAASAYSREIQAAPFALASSRTSLFYDSAIARVLGRLETWRNQFYFYLMDQPDSGRAEQILAALVSGKRHGMPHELRDIFARGGASHLLAISGLHMGILALCFYHLFYLCFRWSPAMLITGRARKWAGLFTLIPLGFYVIFAGGTPSVCRAFLMTAAAMWALLSEQEPHPFNILALAALVILMVDVTALFSISFQLSFMALVFLFLGMGVWDGLALKSRRGVLKWGIAIGVTTLMAGLGTAPLTAHYFNMLSLVQLPVNLVLVPLATVLVLPLGFVVFLLFSINPAWTAFPLWLIQVALEMGLSHLEFWVNLPFAWCRPGIPSHLVLVLIYGALVSTLLGLRYQRFRKPMIICAATLMLVCWGMVKLPREKIQPLEISFLDVGQGSSSLVQTRSGHNLLVDGGGFGSRSRFDTGRYVVAPYLWQKGLQDLDAVILSHPESDHMNGLVFILENFNVGRFVKGGDHRDHPTMARLMKICRDRNIPIFIPDCENDTLELGPLCLEFSQCGTPSDEFTHNDNSLVFRLSFGDLSVLYPGDIMKKRELLLAGQGSAKLKALILLAPHHGSASSSHDFFLDKVNPQRIIISCGWANRYGFPHPGVISRYQSRRIPSFRTDIQGAVILRSNGSGYDILTHKGE